MNRTVELRGHSQAIRSIRYSDDGSLLASLGYDNTIRLWSLAEEKELECFSYEYYGGGYEAIGFGSDNRLYATGTAMARRDDPYSLLVADVDAKRLLASLRRCFESLKGGLSLVR